MPWPQNWGREPSLTDAYQTAVAIVAGTAAVLLPADVSQRNPAIWPLQVLPDTGCGRDLSWAAFEAPSLEAVAGPPAGLRASRGQYAGTVEESN